MKNLLGGAIGVVVGFFLLVAIVGGIRDRVTDPSPPQATLEAVSAKATHVADQQNARHITSIVFPIIRKQAGISARSARP